MLSKYSFAHKYDEEFFDLHEVPNRLQADVYADFLKNFVGFVSPRFRIPKSTTVAIGKSLYASMNDAARTYHSPVYILAQFSWAKKRMVAYPPTEQLAIWFHKAIYNPTAKFGVNEQESARLMSALLSHWLQPSEISHIQASIEDCRKTTDICVSRNQQVIDLDLSVFTWDDISRKSLIKAFIKEQSRVYCMMAIKENRKAFLEKLIKRDPFFHSNWFSSKTYNRTAIDNVKKELRELNDTYRLEGTEMAT